jgi:hypothetical protein
MAIDKAIGQAPLGLDQLSEDEGQEPALEIVIEDPESVEIGVDGQPILRIEDDEEEGGPAGAGGGAQAPPLPLDAAGPQAQRHQCAH